MDAMTENLHKNTGKTLEEWIAIVQKQNFSRHGEILKYLKENHGFTHGYANLVALKARGTDAGSAESSDDLISKQYKGKEALYPIYEALMKEAKKLGKDVEPAPKNAYMSLRRKKQFALIQPSTKSRLDLGLVLKDTPPQGRLEASGSFNSMCSHRVRLQDVKDVDKEVLGWLKAAYEQAG